MSAKEKLIAKISALLAKAESTDNANEAESFMGKVEQMLTEHNISMFELGTTGDDPVHLNKDKYRLSRSLSFATALLPALGRYYGCEIIIERGLRNNYFWVFGRESATTTFHLMAPFIIKQIRIQARKLFKDGKVKTVTKGLTAVANALVYRLNTLTKSRQQSVSSKYTKNQLVCVDAIASLVKQHIPDVQLTERRIKVPTPATRQAAEDIKLARQAENRKVKGYLT